MKIRTLLVLFLILFFSTVRAETGKIFQRDIDKNNFQLLSDSGINLYISVLNKSDNLIAGNAQVSIISTSVGSPTLDGLRYVKELPNSLSTRIPIDFSDIETRFSIGFKDLRDSHLDLLFTFPDGFSEKQYYYQVNLLDVARIQSKDDSQLYTELLTHELLK